MRGCVIFLVEAGSDSAESSVAYNSYKSDIIYNTNTEIKCHVLDWYSRMHSRVVRSTYAAELLSLLDATNQGQLIFTCLAEILNGARSAQSLIDSDRAIPMDAWIDAKAVFDSITADHINTPDDKHLVLHARAMREFLEAGRVDRLCWFGTDDMLPDGLTKGSVDREALVRCCLEGIWRLQNEQPLHWSSRTGVG